MWRGGGNINPATQAATAAQIQNTLAGQYTNPGLSNIANLQIGLTAGGANQSPALSRVGNQQIGAMAGGQYLDPGMTGLANQQQAQTIGGGYLNANPYLDAMYGNAARAMTDQYKMATAPSLMAQAQKGGVGGGSAAQEQQAYNQFNLGQNLSGLASNIYGQNYATERAAQEAAARQAQGLGLSQEQQALAAAGMAQQGGEFGQTLALNAANMAAQQAQAERDRMMQATGLGQQGVLAGQQNQLNAFGLLPTLQGGLMQPGSTMFGVGTIGQDLMQRYMDASQANATARAQYPFQQLSFFGSGLGQAGGGTGTVTATGPNPYAGGGLFGK